MTARDHLRRKLLRQRASTALSARKQAAQRVAHHLAHTPWFHRARNIAAYLSIGGELDTQPIVQLARATGRRIYLPVLTRDGHLWFQYWAYGAPLQRNRFGIMEPPLTNSQRINARALDLVLTPLVGFDHQGNRLGMGGGFYDRTFAYQRLMSRWRHPPLIGLAYEFQEIEILPREPWDVPLAGVVTPLGIKRFSPI